jgi:hypothetical protein
MHRFQTLLCLCFALAVLPGCGSRRDLPADPGPLRTAPVVPPAPTLVAISPAPRYTFRDDVAPLLARYCLGCHYGARAKGGVALDTFADDDSARKDLQLWEKVAHNVRSGSMPPAGRKQPPAAERELLSAWLDDMFQAPGGGPKRPGRVTLRRLNRVEYNNTVRDLLGIDFRPTDDFPADDIGYGFDNIGDVLSLSPLLMEKYLAAAEQVVQRALRSPAVRARLLNPPTEDSAPPAYRAVPVPMRTEAVRRIRQPGDEVRHRPDPKEAELVRAYLILRAFADRAFRRPVKHEELLRLWAVMEAARKEGESFEQGLQVAMQAVLVSPHFLFRVEAEEEPEPGAEVVPVGEYELASRLSYFLWSSMPDEELFRLAAAKRLRAELDGQVRRMLRDPKARALTANFAGQWLQLRNVANLAPDPDLFPQFDDELRRAMVMETELFFEAVAKEDRNILDFLDADFTFVNERLAKHYGIRGVSGPEFRRVRLEGEQRGGILTQASVLSVTSNPTRTSPTKRGKWILDNILNTPPPPPPPDAGELSDDRQEAAAASLRRRMEMHRTKAECAQCHQRMDPLGFSLESYDAIGGWRARDGTFDIDPSGDLPGGSTFIGPQGLRAVLRGKASEFRRCLSEKLLTFALGRGVGPQDRRTMDAICRAVERNQNRFSSLVLAVVQSDPFLYRNAHR